MELGEDSKVSPKEEPWKVEPGELLEEGWFFGNLLDRKTKVMSRCYSDPCPSSNVSPEMLVGRSYEETYSSINKVLHAANDRSRGRDGEGVTTPQPPHPPRPSLMRTPSMPSPNRNKSSRVQSINNSSNNHLQRLKSLPAMDMDNFEDEDSDYSMGSLIRQASLGQSHTLPPRQQTPKKLIPSTIAKQNNPRKKSEQEGSTQGTRQQVLKQANNETSFVKDFKGSDVDSLIKEIYVLPKLQEEKIRKPYVPEARKLARTTSASPVLDNIGRYRTTDDIMKAQIKFWARAVASNVI